jgi:hypothetical protein
MNMTEDKTQRRFSVKHLNISRSSFSKDADFTATLSVESQYGNEIKVKLPEDRVEALIDSVSDLVLEALQEQFTGMREDFQAVVEHKKQQLLESQTVDADTVQ